MATKRSVSAAFSNLDELTFSKRERKEPKRFVSEEKKQVETKKRRSSSPRLRHFKEYTLRKKETKSFKEVESDEDLESEEEEDENSEDVPRRSRKKNPLSSPSKQERSSEDDLSEDAADGKEEKEEDSDSEEEEVIERIFLRRQPKIKSNSNNNSEEFEPETRAIKKFLPPLPKEFTEPLFLIKLQGKSYHDLEWVTASDIEKEFSNGKQKLNRFLTSLDEKNSVQDEDTEDSEGLLFNPDFLKIDRVIDMVGEGNDIEVLVKWKGLSYDQCTWEFQDEFVPKVKDAQEKIDLYLKLNSKEARKNAHNYKPRPKPSNIDEKSLKPPKFKNENELKDYQEVGFKWLVHCWVNKRNTILADEMGLGKTIQAISMLQYLYVEQEKPGPFIVVAPMSTIEQWKREIEEWTDMNIVIFHGSAEARDLIYETEWFFKDEKKSYKTYKFHVIVTTYEVAIIESRRLASVPWEYLIIDEGHRIKNNKSKLLENLKRYKAAHKLLLTGTPLQNGVNELWTLMNFLEPKRFNSCSEFMNEFGDLKESSQVQKLHKKLGPYMLRRLKEDVATYIPHKEEILVEIELTSIQKTYYKAILEKNKDFLAKGAAKASLMNIVMQLRKCCNHPYLIRGAEEKIAVGLDTIKAINEKLVSSSSKFVFVDKLLERLRREKHRVLIFSQMTRVLDLLEDYVKFKNYPFERLDGGVSRTDRQEAIDRFSNPMMDSFVFLLGTRAGGLGINLTIADTVILFDSDWNPQNDIQAQARCHRIGQEKSVKVYRLITRNTYEKKMFVVASKKLGLDKVVLGKQSNEESGLEGLSKEQMEKLLKFGAYELFNNGEDTKAEDFDLDKILQRATTVNYDNVQNETNTNLSSFSKATFVVSEEDKVDINDVKFWEKVLPSFKTVARLNDTLKDETALDSEEKRASFLKDLETLVTDFEIQREERSESSSDPSQELILLLTKVKSIDKFSAEQQVPVNKWIEVLEAPRLRKRVNRKEAPKVEDSNSNSNANSKKESNAKKESNTKKESNAKKDPNAKKQASSNTRGDGEWAKSQRDRFKSAMAQFGYGRWKQISDLTKAPGRSIEEMQALGESMLYKLLGVQVSPENEDANFYEIALEETVEDCKVKVEALKSRASKETTSTQHKVTIETEMRSPLHATDSLTLKFTGIPPQELAPFIGFYMEDEEELVRVIPVTGEKLLVVAPGFGGKYTIRFYYFANGKKVECGKTKSFKIEPHPVLCTEDFDKVTVTGQKILSNKLELLHDLQEVISQVDVDTIKMPTLLLNIPKIWWNNDDDRKLIKGVYKYGYQKWNDMIEDKSFGWDVESLKKRVEKMTIQPSQTNPKKDKDKEEGELWDFPNSTVLNKRLQRLVQEILKTKDKTEKTEKKKESKSSAKENNKENEKPGSVSKKLSALYHQRKKLIADQEKKKSDSPEYVKEPAKISKKEEPTSMEVDSK